MSVIVSRAIAAPSPLPRASRIETPSSPQPAKALTYATPIETSRFPPFRPSSRRRASRDRSRINTHFLFFLHGFCFPPVARRLCKLSREMPVVGSPSSSSVLRPSASRRRRVDVAVEREARERFRSRRRVVAHAPMVGRDRPLRGAKRRRGARIGAIASAVRRVLRLSDFMHSRYF